MIVSIDVDAQKTFTPLCPDELPVNEGHLIVEELNFASGLVIYWITMNLVQVAQQWFIFREERGPEPPKEDKRKKKEKKEK